MLSGELVPCLSIIAAFGVVAYYSGFVYGIVAAFLVLVSFVILSISNVGGAGSRGQPRGSGGRQPRCV